jgi:hypothetical protein
MDIVNAWCLPLMKCTNTKITTVCVAVRRMQLEQEVRRTRLLQQEIDIDPSPSAADGTDSNSFSSSSSSSSSGSHGSSDDATASGMDLERALVSGSGVRKVRNRFDRDGAEPNSSPLQKLRDLQRSPSVAQVASVLDAVGVQLGRLLRGGPHIRVGVVLYVIVLHLWVTFVFYHMMHQTSALHSS